MDDSNGAIGGLFAAEVVEQRKLRRARETEGRDAAEVGKKQKSRPSLNLPAASGSSDDEAAEGNTYASSSPAYRTIA